MTSIATIAPADPPDGTGYRRKLAAVAGIAAFADWLFYRQAIGLSIAVFILVLDAVALLANSRHATRRTMLLAAGVLVAALLPLIDDCNVISVAFAAIGAAYFARAATTGRSGAIGSETRAAVRLLFSGPLQMLQDVAGAQKRFATHEKTVHRVGAFTIWVIPIVLGAVFLALFASANPLLESWLGQIDPRAFLADISFGRILFWLTVISLTWSFVFIR